MSAKQYISLSYLDRRDWLRLIRSANVGPATFHQLLARFGGAAEALAALPELVRRSGAKRARLGAKESAEREIAGIAALGGRLIAHGEADYPPRLRMIEDAPPLIHVLGNPELLTKKSIAIVGSRNASTNGLSIAREIAGDLGRSGYSIVSGLARGLDAAAHEGAIKTGTVAILGGGVDVIYPRQNTDLYHQIRESGALVSEAPLGAPPTARSFPQRNRIISGMSRGIVVVEAAPRSGSLITARLALDQGREVFAIPGSPRDPRCRGGNQLIRDGAILTESADDVFAGFDEAGSGVAALPMSDALAEEPAPVVDADAIEKPDLDPHPTTRRAVLNALGPTPTPIDELLRTVGDPPASIATVLLELELAGRMERLPGNRVALVGME